MRIELNPKFYLVFIFYSILICVSSGEGSASSTSSINFVKGSDLVPTCTSDLEAKGLFAQALRCYYQEQNKDAALALEARLLSGLQSELICKQISGFHSSGPLECSDPQGVRWILKPMTTTYPSASRSQSAAYGEVFSYLFSQAFEFYIVPLTVPLMHLGKSHTAQLYVSDGEPFQKNLQTMGDWLRANSLETLSKYPEIIPLYIFDFLLGLSDRHSENLLVWKDEVTGAGTNSSSTLESALAPQAKSALERLSAERLSAERLSAERLSAERLSAVQPTETFFAIDNGILFQSENPNYSNTRNEFSRGIHYLFFDEPIYSSIVKWWEENQLKFSNRNIEHFFRAIRENGIADKRVSSSNAVSDQLWTVPKVPEDLLTFISLQVDNLKRFSENPTLRDRKPRAYVQAPDVSGAIRCVGAFSHWQE